MSKHTHVDDLDADPILMPHQGRLVWLFPSGRMVPTIRGGEGEEGEKKFTQADVDRLIADRIARVKAEPPADYAQLQAAATELAALKASTATAEEATNARIAALEKAIQESKDAATAATAAAAEEKRRSAIVAAAATQKAANPDQVAALLAKDAVTIGDDGRVTGAEEAVKTFLDANPHFVGTPVRPQPDKGQGKAGETKTFGDGGRAEAQKRFGTLTAVGTTTATQQ